MDQFKEKTLFISPHLDDVVLSCGGCVHKEINELDSVVTVVTIFTGLPEPDTLSEAAKEFHNSINLGDNAISVRRSEDIEAASFLNFKTLHLGFLESQYRQNPNGSHRYKCLLEIFKAYVDEEKDTLDQVTHALKNVITASKWKRIFIPLGNGNHIDHLITRRAVENISQECGFFNHITYYEDMPYSYYDRNGENTTPYTKEMECYLEPLSAESFMAKVGGVEIYQSQVNMLWGSPEHMKKAYLDYAYSISQDKEKVYERYWKYT